jgi:hypothetical protein
MLIADGFLESVTPEDIIEGHCEVPANVTRIGYLAFERLTTLTNIMLPVGLKYLGEKAFLGCTGLRQITLPPLITRIESDTFAGLNLEDIILPAQLTKICFQAFRGCTGLTDITFPPKLISIGTGAFENCTALREISFPPGFSEMGEEAFSGCINLTQVIFPIGVKKIHPSAFYGCTQLKTITIDSDNPEEIERFKHLLPNVLRDKVISKSEHIRTIRKEIAFAAVLREGNVFNSFFSPKARSEEHTLADPQLIGTILDFL